MERRNRRQLLGYFFVSDRDRCLVRGPIQRCVHDQLGQHLTVKAKFLCFCKGHGAALLGLLRAKFLLDGAHIGAGVYTLFTHAGDILTTAGKACCAKAQQTHKDKAHEDVQEDSG